MSIGKNIKRIREENMLTQKELAEIAGVTDKAVSMWEQEKRDPRMGAMQRIADRFGIRLSELIGEGDADVRVLEGGIISVPVLGFVPPCGRPPAKEEIEGYEPVRVENVVRGEKYIFYRISDNSMEPFLKYGDLALIHLKNYIKSGGYAVISVSDGQPVIRRLIYSGDEVELISENRSFGIQRFVGEDLKKLCVLGEVEMLVRKF